jgi:hypothetical protein
MIIEGNKLMNVPIKSKNAATINRNTHQISVSPLKNKANIVGMPSITKK